MSKEIGQVYGLDKIYKEVNPKGAAEQIIKIIRSKQDERVPS